MVLLAPRSPPRASPAPGTDRAGGRSSPSRRCPPRGWCSPPARASSSGGSGSSRSAPAPRAARACSPRPPGATPTPPAPAAAPRGRPAAGPGRPAPPRGGRRRQRRRCRSSRARLLLPGWRLRFLHPGPALDAPLRRRRRRGAALRPRAPGPAAPGRAGRRGGARPGPRAGGPPRLVRPATVAWGALVLGVAAMLWLLPASSGRAGADGAVSPVPPSAPALLALLALAAASPAPPPPARARRPRDEAAGPRAPPRPRPSRDRGPLAPARRAHRPLRRPLPLRPRPRLRLPARRRPRPGGWPLAIALHGWRHTAGPLARPRPRRARRPYGVAVVLPEMSTSVFEHRLVPRRPAAPGAASPAPAGSARWSSPGRAGPCRSPPRRAAPPSSATRPGAAGALVVAGRYPEFAFAGSLSGTFDLGRLRPGDGEYAIHEEVFGSRATHPGRWSRRGRRPGPPGPRADTALFAAHGAADAVVRPDQLAVAGPPPARGRPRRRCWWRWPGPATTSSSGARAARRSSPHWRRRSTCPPLLRQDSGVPLHGPAATCRPPRRRAPAWRVAAGRRSTASRMAGLLLLGTCLLALASPAEAASARRRRPGRGLLSALLIDGQRIAVRWTDGDTFHVDSGPLRGRSVRLADVNALESYGPVHRIGTLRARPRSSSWRAPRRRRGRRRSGSCTAARRTATSTAGRWSAAPRRPPPWCRPATPWSSRWTRPADPGLLALQREAQAAGRGMWAGGVPPRLVSSLHSPRRARRGPARRLRPAGGHRHRRRQAGAPPPALPDLPGGLPGRGPLASCMRYVPIQRRYRNRPACLVEAGAPRRAGQPGGRARRRDLRGRAGSPQRQAWLRSRSSLGSGSR